MSGKALIGAVAIVTIIAILGYIVINDSDDDSKPSVDPPVTLNYEAYPQNLDISSNNKIIYENNDGNNIEIVYHIATLKNYTIAQLGDIARGGLIDSITCGWGESSSNSFEKSVTQAISHTTGKETIGVNVEVKIKNVSVGAGVEWTSGTSTSTIEEYKTSLKREVQESSNYSVTVKVGDNTNLYYRLACVAAQCYVYERVIASAYGELKEISYILEYKDKHLEGQCNTSADFGIPDDVYVNAYIDPTNDINDLKIEESGGSGTSSDPYLISDYLDLMDINKELDAHYKLTRDIIIPSQINWIPIGDTGNGAYLRFSGVLDGNEKSITFSLKDSPHKDGGNAQVGLFAMIGHGTVKNIKLNVDIYVSKDTSESDYGLNIGALAGTIAGGTIEQCIVTGTIKTDTQICNNIRTNMGGIVGRVCDSPVSIAGCENYAILIAYGDWSEVGGIVGTVSSSNLSVSKCANYADIYANGSGAGFNPKRYSANAGGIIGSTIDSGYAEVSYCINSGKMNTVGRYMDSAGIIGCAHAGKQSYYIQSCRYLANTLLENGKIQENVAVDGNNDNRNIVDVTMVVSIDELKNSYNSW